jgi:nucleoside phosphorylase
MVLVCFAVTQEAQPFKKACGGRAGIKILVTGMGKANAEKAIRKALKMEKPELVWTCGFAGGLRPDLKIGTVLFDTDGDTQVTQQLEAAGAINGRFAFSTRVATTAAEKRALWEQTKADAVEMESQVVRAICREHKIPSATVRVVLDTAAEDLPLDFNRLMTGDFKMSYARMTATILRSPAIIPELLTLQKKTRMAAERLASVLTALM